MIDVEWNDNAKAAVEAYNNWLEDNQETNAVEEFFTDLARITTQPKTVADAAEYYKGSWPTQKCSTIWVDGSGAFRWGNEVTNQTVCTRAEFEAYVKEQEGEKWTHTYKGEKCRIVTDEPDSEGMVCCVYELDMCYAVTDPKELKPIKPTISKAEAWDKLNEEKCSVHEFGSKLIDLQKEYEII